MCVVQEAFFSTNFFLVMSMSLVTCHMSVVSSDTSQAGHCTGTLYHTNVTTLLMSRVHSGCVSVKRKLLIVLLFGDACSRQAVAC
jgi:hypothetical protein